MSQITAVCADPSCFVSLKNQKEFLKILDKITAESPEPVKVVLPTVIYEALLQEPNKKFTQLQEILEDWNEPVGKKLKFSFKDKPRYVNNTRSFLDKYSPKPAHNFIGSIEKLGKESIYSDDVREKLGEITGNIVFELMAMSSEMKFKIISFGKQTISLITRLSVSVKEGHSAYKERIKSHLGIRGLIRFLQFAMSAEVAREFMSALEINEILLTPAEIGLGVLIIADG